ncbi:type IV pilus modification protein PilV [Biformimicrobium ophioploci]|uniref:Type IV pilus modification protein PilV n=1 Tax=Biformimicrobium ophioploci TaxID=3036711 RepID=A0ABQ6M2K6_9GAMM|nr:type IV pilus modification protein PilV [Microbulbifer sp. NKW57]GMG88586.1 hypothetical protein MNKW57_29070 [Microbulbifer sp. NKW57]
MMRRPQGARGATLIEVLITIFVMAVGLLGLSATQMVSMRNNSNTHMRYIAALAAYDITERMRANPDGVFAGHYSDKSVPGDGEDLDCSVGCSIMGLADLDLHEWGELIAADLPEGVGTISRVNGRTVQVIISWQEGDTGEKRAARANDDCQNTGCFFLEVEL